MIKDHKSEQLPCSLDFERLLLGSVMLNSSAMDDLRAALDTDDFSLDKHRTIWAAMCGLYDRGVRIDRMVLHEELETRGQVASVDGLSYLVTLDDGLPMMPNLTRYVAVLKEKTALRRLMAVAHNTWLRCAQGADSAEEIASDISTALVDLNASSAPGKRPVSSRELIDTLGMDELLKPRRMEGIRLPWERLNGALCGLHPGQMIVMAADTGRGKTSFALQVATHVTRQGKSPIIWTLEMSPRQNFTRIVSQMAQTDANRSRHDLLTGQEVARRKDAAYWLHDHRVWFDSHSRNVPSFCASVRQARAQSEIGLVVVDYLQLIGSAKRTESRRLEVGENSRALKLAAMDLGLPFLVLSQFRRHGDEEAGIHHLKETGDIENDADVILLLSAPKLDGDQPLPVKITVGKQREGPAGFDIPLVFHPPSQTFYSEEQ